MEIWTKITEKEPKNCITLNNIGTAYMMKNQIDEAITVFKKCLEFEPNSQLAKNNLAWALGEKK
ncbi:MAG: tetratricopeptide repeat protein [Sphingobium sp.]|nr:MAG: tetratricopeptide repeat protein [Sphingobium sp.]